MPSAGPDAGHWLRPDWPAPCAARALVGTRHGGSLRLDAADPQVAERRRRFAAELGAEPTWMHQVHGVRVLRLNAESAAQPQTADAAITRTPGLACAVFAADCLPVLLSSDDGRIVGAAHAGWRGLAAGVLQATVQAMCDEAGCEPDALQAWLGPCIGARQFEVGAEVLQAFGADPDDHAATDAATDAAFVRRDRPDGAARWLADLPLLARRRLQAAGVTRIGGGHWCTVEQRSGFFSFRGGDRLGRFGAAIACAAP
ncbi:MAG: peptidoglycan editing factor PgeF [Proteobacteria bacterium]|nr:peptidoglycan editing factor PgeF [Pseudomonadota bacterium]